MRLDDRAADREPHPQPARLGGEIGLEEPLGRGGGQSPPGIVHHDLRHAVGAPRGLHLDLPPPHARFPDGVDGVLDEVDEHLLDLDAIGEDRQRARPEMEPQQHVLLLHVPRQPPGGVAHQLA